MQRIDSWVKSANTSETPFPLNNLPLGVFTIGNQEPRCGVAIGDMILDATTAEQQGLLSFPAATLLNEGSWNPLMAAGPETWASLRDQLFGLLSTDSDHQAAVKPLLVDAASAALHMPLVVCEYTDFYSGKNHAVNVGTMFRGKENALQPNWLHMPVGYNGRASSVVVSGTPVRRPWGQLKSADQTMPDFAPSQRFDFELELGAIVGSRAQGPLSVDEADQIIFGYVLLNDWSARDIQAWEYVPLGPFLSKATATTISPWIVMAAALDPFRAEAPARDEDLLPHLRDTGPMLYDIELEVELMTEDGGDTLLTKTNCSELYYSSAQQIAHHASSGCLMRNGDLIGSGTISGSTSDSRGSMLEISWGGEEPVNLGNGKSRTFLEDGDVITISGAAKGDGYTIGFGDCTGEILPALDDPFSGKSQR